MAAAATRKAHIPSALREAVWVHYIGNKFEAKCTVSWCPNKISPFRYHVGHDVPESKGGSTTIDNLRPICEKCNLSMGNKYTIREWSRKFSNKKQGLWWWCCGAGDGLE